MKLVYLSHPYTPRPPFVFIKRCWNIYKAWRLTAKLWDKGYLVICPVLNTSNFELLTNLTYGDYLKRDLELLKKCNLLILAPDWKKSNGCKAERAEAQKLRLRIIDLSKENI
jgi:hypothetical protein